MGVFLQNGCLLQHENHLKENGEAAASGLLYQDLTVRNGERVAIDIHCGVLFVTYMQDDTGIIWWAGSRPR